MRAFQVSFFLLAIVIIAAVAKKSDDEEWEEFKQKHGKKHKTPQEEEKRKSNFLKTHKMIEEHNSKSDSTFRMKHNKMSDWDPEEKAKVKGANPSFGRAMAQTTGDEDQFYGIEMRQTPPASLDYRTHTCLSAVKDQGNCGSCWAFTAMTPLEFATCNKTLTKTKVSLSEQQLVDCVSGGCNGGWYESAWSFLKTKGTLTSTAYPYTAVMKSVCPAVATSAARPYSWGTVASTPTAIKNALIKYGPLAAALDVQDPFMNYEIGIFSDTTCTQTEINHAVVIVGYGTSNGCAFWIVRNSWGVWWGNNGYILIKLGVNMCGIESFVRFVTV